MNYKRLTTAALAGLILAFGCKSQYEELLQSNDTQAKYSAAFDYFNKGKYGKSAQLFESLAMLTQGTAQDDTVNFYWALSNYNQKDYYTAESNLEHFIQNYPSSPFAENAEFLMIDCLYRSTLRYELDQAPTYKAIKAISEYKISHINSPNVAICNRMLTELEERLDRKAYENAKLYYTMEDYKNYEKLSDEERKGYATRPALVEKIEYPMTKQGQYDFMEDFLNRISHIKGGKGKGFFYWEPAWIPVPGSGWATPASLKYMNDPGPCGNEWANQALFDYDGNALPTLSLIRDFKPEV